jgi:hypothetical protein
VQRRERLVEAAEVLEVDADVVERARALERVAVRDRQREALLVPLEADVGPARTRMDDADRAHRRRLRGEVARVLGDRERAQVVGERLRRVAQGVVDLPDAAQRVGAADVVAHGLEQRERLAVGLERARLVERELGGAALEVAGARPRTGVGDERGELGSLGGEARGVARVVRERVGRFGQQRDEPVA